MERNLNQPESISLDFQPEAVVVGGGDFPTHPIPLSLLNNGAKIVCCDGTANQWPTSAPEPWQIVGDGDSISKEAKTRFAGRIYINPDQETNDQTKAINFLAQHGMRRIAIIGGTGRREDHTLGNISLLMEYLRQGLEVRMYTDYGVFIPCKHTNHFESPTGTAVSIFSFGTKGMASEGLAYPLYDFTSWWQGTLNHTLQPTFKITCEGEYLVFINYENKKIRE